MSPAHTLATDQDGPLPHVVADGVITLGRVAARFDVEGALPALETLLAAEPGLTGSDLHRAAARHDVVCTTHLVAALVTAQLLHWDRGGSGLLCLAVPVGDLVGTSQERELLAAWTGACERLAMLREGFDDPEARAATAMSHLCARLAGTDPDAAVAAGINGVMLAYACSATGPAITAAAGTLFAAANGHDEDVARLALAWRARGLSLVDPSARDDLALWDAVESACRYRPTAEPAATAAATEVRAVLDSVGTVRDLGPTYTLAFLRDPAASAALDRLRPLVDPVWQFDADALQSTMAALQGISTEFDERRLLLIPPPERSVATADIDAWSIDHHAFRSAVPFSTGFRRESAQADIVLTLGHELVHIDSAYGWLGTAVSALRTAATADEVLHHVRLSGEGTPDPEVVGGLASLEPEAVLLPFVERQLELVVKARILRDVWTPWLEGVAVFGELACDPTTDTERTTSFGGPLVHLVDRVWDPAHDPPVEEWYAARHGEAEQLYADALGGLAAHRLRTYLGRSHSRYLAGYLAVRGVVAAWRAQRDLGGIEAYQSLLGATRATTRHALPDLSLPLEEFEERAVALMTEWVGRTAALDDRAIARLDPYRRRTPLDPWTGEEAHEPTTRDAALLAEAAAAPRSGRDRELGHLTPETRGLLAPLLDIAAPSMGTLATDDLQHLSNDRARRMHLVPIGRFDALFWLWVGEDGSRTQLFLQLRVTSETVDDGRGGYSLYGIPLTPDEMALLRSETARLRGARMEVHRFVDRADSRENGLTSGQVLALRYGEFVKAVPSGLCWGIDPTPSMLEDVTARVRPDTLTLLDLRVNDGPALARRARSWLTRVEGSDVHPAVPAWCDLVQGLATLAASPGSPGVVDRSGRALLGLLGWPGEQVEDVLRVGVRALASDESAALGPLLATLLATGVAGPTDAPHDLDPGFLDSLFSHRGPGWDVRPLQKEES
ncbi:hypothetical protein [Cellulosimicrobium protaetiae]|uniref:Uncharacterized protein n=1 Tax=Cellulosimicrobium protaetiae TaxID=2587808 RepID=A0A6M5UJ79_9MICO|nr:hypothetical protein [Cellulosimicrobium protaetiae]QJW37138.1 hypothetical protein FIC82_014030 [Cellulosimicrobium protaetiae]